MAISTFQRREVKFMLSQEQFEALMPIVHAHMNAHAAASAETAAILIFSISLILKICADCKLLNAAYILSLMLVL